MRTDGSVRNVAGPDEPVEAIPLEPGGECQVEGHHGNDTQTGPHGTPGVRRILGDEIRDEWEHRDVQDLIDLRIGATGFGSVASRHP